jgi:transcriptional regulator with XRE-family HTH domain
MKANGFSYSEIETETGVSHGGLQKIINGSTYRETRA